MLDERDENRRSDGERKETGATEDVAPAAERGPDASGREVTSNRTAGRPTNRERIRAYDRDHPGQTVGQVAEALGINHGTVSDLRRKIRLEQPAALKAEKRVAAREPGVETVEFSEEDATDDAPPVTERAETQAATKITTHLSDVLAKRTNDAIDEVLEIGDRIRNWYMGKGLHTDPQFPTSTVFVNHVLEFWWKSRDMIPHLREIITDLSDRLIAQNAHIRALNAYIDPDRLYERRVDQIFSYATECKLAGVNLDRVMWERMWDQAVAQRDAMRAHPPTITSHSDGEKLWDTRNR